jgi:TfoX/Sxy family transcriptional regulator of competence genes
MSYDEKLAERVRRVLSEQRGVIEREMFGGLAFLLEGKMFVGILKRELMVRVGPKRYPTALAKPHARPMDFTGKPLTGYVFVAARGVETARALGAWVREGKEFVTSLAKPRKKATQKKTRKSTTKPKRSKRSVARK